MPRMPAYQSRYGDAITELLSRRGDIAAQGALRSGEIWGSTVAGLGNLAANTYQQYSEQKQQKKSAEMQAQAFDDALQTYDPTRPMETYRKLATVLGPEKAMDVTKGFQAFGHVKSARKPEEALAALPKLAAGFEAAPEAVRAQLWTPVREALIGAGVTDASMPEQYDPETAAGYIQFAKGLDKQAMPKAQTLDQQYATAVASGDQRAIDSALKSIAAEAAAKRDPSVALARNEAAAARAEAAAIRASERAEKDAEKKAAAEKEAESFKGEVDSWVSNLEQGQALSSITSAKLKSAANDAYVKKHGQRPLASAAEAEQAQGLEKMAGQLRNVDEAEEAVLKRFDTGVMANPVGRTVNKAVGAVLEGDYDIPLPFGTSLPIGKTAKAFSTDPDITRLETQKSGLGNIARSQGEKGALSNQDIERVATTIGKLGETREQVNVKRKERWDILNRARASLGRLPKVTTEAEYNKLSPFEAYIGPDGQQRTKVPNAQR